MPLDMTSATDRLPGYRVRKNQHSVSGLSSGAFMTVQLHLAHSSHFIGAGIIAGGPYRCAESLRSMAMTAEDSFALNALYICMTPLTQATAPNARRLAELARQTASEGRIDPTEHLAGQRLYIFTGSQDAVVTSNVVKSTRRFYEHLGVNPDNILFIDTVAAGHSIITRNPADTPLPLNQPPYINCGPFIQSQDILRYIYPDLKPAALFTTGRLMRFDQSEFLGEDAPRASMSAFGYVYVPASVLNGEEARAVHIVLHGCQQGHDYVNYSFGRPDVAHQPPYGNRYITTTGYNELADTNGIVVLYPQVEGDDDDQAQNPDGCWDWWGYSSRTPDNPDYYSRDAVQIRAIYAMLERVCSGAPARSGALARTGSKS